MKKRKTKNEKDLVAEKAKREKDKANDKIMKEIGMKYRINKIRINNKINITIPLLQEGFESYIMINRIDDKKIKEYERFVNFIDGLVAELPRKEEREIIKSIYLNNEKIKVKSLLMGHSTYYRIKRNAVNKFVGYLLRDDYINEENLIKNINY